MLHGDPSVKIAVRAPVLIEALENNYKIEPACIHISDEIPAVQLAFWELGIIAVNPVSNMYKLFCISDVCPERTISSVLNNIHNRGMFSLINPRGADGSMRCSVANLRAWRNRITTDKMLAGSVNLFMFNSDHGAHAAVLFAMSIVDIGGSACIRVGNINTTALASAVYAFAGYFTARIHRVCNGDIYLIGTHKTKTLRAESMFTMAAMSQDMSLYTADYMRGDHFRATVDTMTTIPELVTADQWKRTYKYEYITL